LTLDGGAGQGRPIGQTEGRAPAPDGGTGGAQATRAGAPPTSIRIPQSDVRLVNLMPDPVTIWVGGDMSRAFTFPAAPEDQCLWVNFRADTVGCYGENGGVTVIYEYPLDARGIPAVIDPRLRYIVQTIAFDRIQDRKDFITPAKPVRNRQQVVQAYRCFKGHEKLEVDRFFMEAAGLGKGGRQ
jgi:hypothetical protein